MDVDASESVLLSPDIQARFAAEFSPLSMLAYMRRYARIDPGQLPSPRAVSLDPQALKRQWLTIAEQAERSVVELADHQPGLAIGGRFVDASGAQRWPDPSRIREEQGLSHHQPSVGGCMPLIRPVGRTDI